MTRQRQFLNIIACLIGLSAFGWITPSYGQTPPVNNVVSGNALDFDGTRDFVDTKAYISGSYTKEAWVYLRGTDQFNNVVSGDSLGANTAFWIPNLNGSRLAAGQNSNFLYVEDPEEFPLNKWVHIAVTYNMAARTMTLYKNGIQVAQNKNIRTTDAYNTEGDSLYIGSFSKFIPGENPTFNGQIDEVRIWNKARTAQGISDSLRTALTGNEPGLIAYYDFNQGTAEGDNTGLDSLIDRSVPSNEDGMLRDFALTGTTSNWVASDVANADITTPTGYSVKVDQAFVSPANQTAISFTFAGAGVGTTYDYTFTDTAGVQVSGTGSIATATDQVTGIDLSSLAEGPITLAATLTNTTSGNTGAQAIAKVTKDTTPPSVAITSLLGSLTNQNPFSVTITFNEKVSGFAAADLTLTNATVDTMQTTADSTVFTASLIPDAPGDVTVNVAADVATDLAGNANAAAAQVFTITYDPDALTVNIFTLPASQAQHDSIPVTITFSERVSGFAAADLTLTNVTAGKVQTTDSTVFTVNVVPAAEGESNMTIAENAVTDLAGNPNTAATPLVFSGSGGGTAPSVTLSSSVTGATNTAPIPATITFSEKVNGFDSVDVTLVNGTLATLTTQDSITFAAGITPAAEGAVKVTVADSVAQNAGGVFSTASADTLTLMYDITAPTVTLTTAEADTTQTSPFAVTITFSEKVSGFVAADLAPTNATVSDLQSTDSITFTANVTPTPDTTVTVTLNIAADAVGDLAGNGNTVADPLSLVYNGAPPVTGIEEISILHRLDIYPVPASEYLKVDGYLEQSAVVSYQLTSQSGKLYKQKRLGKVNSIKETLSLDNVGAGLYLFTLYVDGKPVTSKIIITK